MAQDISVLQSNNMPAHLQNAPAQRNSAALTGTGGGESVNRISLKQSRFRLIKGGEEVAVLPSNDLDLVLLRINEGVTKTYYETKWNPNQEAEAPTCRSDDGIYPSPDSRKIQARTCAECPHNVWGSKINPQTGAQGKACSDSKRVSVIPADDVRGEPFQLAVPAASLGDLGKYLRQLDSVNPPVPYNAVITRVSFDTNATFPKLQFAPVRYLDANEYNVVENERFEEHDVKITAGIPMTQTGPQVPYNQQAQQAQADSAPQAAPAQPAPAQPAQEAPAGWGGQPAQQTPAQPTQDAQQAPAGWGTQPAQQPPAQPAQEAQQAPAGWGTQPAQEAPAQQAQEAPAQPSGAAAQEGSLDDIFGGDWDD